MIWLSFVSLLSSNKNCKSLQALKSSKHNSISFFVQIVHKKKEFGLSVYQFWGTAYTYINLILCIPVELPW